MCIPPGDDKHGVMLIDPQITELCRQQAEIYRQDELANPTPRPATTSNSSRSPGTPPLHRKVNASGFKPINYQSDESPSDASTPDHYIMSPMASPAFRDVFSPALIPRSTPRLVDLDQDPVSPKSLAAGLKFKQLEDKRLLPSAISSPAVSPKSHTKGFQAVDIDEDYDGDASEMEIDQGSSPRRVDQGGLNEVGLEKATKDIVEASQTLLLLHEAGASKMHGNGDAKGRKVIKRRYSAFL